MRKFLTRLGLPVLAVALFMASAAATYNVPPVVTYDLGFVHQRLVAGSYIANLDSSLSITPASFASISLTDTSESFDLRSCAFRGPHTFWHATFGSIADTVWAFNIALNTMPSYAGVTGADSLELTYQVSPDNIVWTSLDTIGVSTKTRSDLSSTGAAVISLYSTSHGIGTKRINWDRQAANFVRVLLRRDPNAASGTAYKLTLTTRSYGTNK